MMPNPVRDSVASMPSTAPPSWGQRWTFEAIPQVHVVGQLRRLGPAGEAIPPGQVRRLEAPQRRADPPRRAGVIRPGGTGLVVTTDNPRKRGSKATKGAGPSARGC